MVNGDSFDALRKGQVVPAMPLALNPARKLDERRQRALCRYYIAAGAGGVAAGGSTNAVSVRGAGGGVGGGFHTTQCAIRERGVGLFKPVLQIVAEEFARAEQRRTALVRVGG